MGSREGAVFRNQARNAMRSSARSSNRSTCLPCPLEPLKEGHRMDPRERLFLEAVERGDKNTVFRCLHGPETVNVNCTNIMGRSAIQIAVDNENVEIVELLLKQDGVLIGDALLYAIREGVYRIVEMLIDHPSITRDMLGADWSKYKPGEDSSDYSPDISPIILAAHCNQFEILQLLISRGAKIDRPHMLTCDCQRCQNRVQEDSLRHSLLRIHTYRALSSPAWICLTSPDPVLTAFRLSWELERLARRENEFADIFCELSEQCKKFSCELLEQCRSSEEVMAVLNKGNEEEDQENEGKEIPNLCRFRLALKYEQKQFVAHPHCQQLLASIWYAGLPGWRKRNVASKIFIIIGLIILLPFASIYYLLCPRGRFVKLLRTPFMKFMYHSTSFGVFLVLLTLVSTNMSAADGQNLRPQQRGPPPTVLEWFIVLYVMGFIWSECNQLWDEGLKAYIRQWWNWLDFIMLSLYLATFSLRLVAFAQSLDEDYYGPNNMDRKCWPENDPTLISEGVFAIANVFSFARIIYLFQANPQLGPLQISLGCMLIDIGKFFFIFFLVITSFACGLNQLYYYYPASGVNDTLSDPKDDNAFATLPKSYQTLFWSLFGLTQLDTVREGNMQDFTKRIGEYLLLAYHAMAVIVLVNMLIAMMSNSFQEIEDHADREWKFARSKLWMGYFDEGSTLPPPFNLIISPKSIYYLSKWIKDNIFKFCQKQPRTTTTRRRSSADGTIRNSQNVSVVNTNHVQNHMSSSGLDLDLVIRNAQATGVESLNEQPTTSTNSTRKLRAKDKTYTRYEDVMRRLVTRFIHKWKQQMRQDGVNEDDLLEIKQDISSLRYELREDRKRGANRTSSQIESLKRDILVSIRHYSGMASSTHNTVPLPEDRERPGSPTFHASPSGTFLDREDMESLKREIVHSLRSEIRDIARELATQSAQNARASPINVPALMPALNSDLYQTHLYTQL